MAVSSRRERCDKSGRDAEMRFIKDLKAAHPELRCVMSSKDDNIYRRIDLYIYKTGLDKGTPVDIKSYNGSDNVSIELVNVNGKFGSVFGESRFIVYETKTQWVFVDREVLLRFLVPMIVFEFTFDKSETFKLYTRPRRKDLMTFVPITFIDSIKSTSINKTTT